jgi:hypothetical protein
VQTEAPAGEYVPAAQSEQVVEAAPLYWPALQLEQAEDSTLVAALVRYLPAGQLEHELEPSPENFPASQMPQKSIESISYFPAGHEPEKEHVPISKLLVVPDIVPPLPVSVSKLEPAAGVPLQSGGQVECTVTEAWYT